MPVDDGGAQNAPRYSHPNFNPQGCAGSALFQAANDLAPARPRSRVARSLAPRIDAGSNFLARLAIEPIADFVNGIKIAIERHEHDTLRDAIERLPGLDPLRRILEPDKGLMQGICPSPSSSECTLARCGP